MTTDIAKRPPGRPSKLTTEIISKLAQYVAEGNYYQTAAECAGIDDRTFHLWMAQARKDAETGDDDPENLYLQLLRAIKSAEAQSEAERVARIRAAGIGGQVARRITKQKRDGTLETEETFQLPQWLADITFLERRHRERWGRPAPVQVSVDNSKTVQITHVEVSLDEASRMDEIIEGEAREMLTE